MQLIIKINMDNSAFDTNYIPEVNRILSDLITYANDNNTYIRTLRDIKGNKVGISDIIV